MHTVFPPPRRALATPAQLLPFSPAGLEADALPERPTLTLQAGSSAPLTLTCALHPGLSLPDTALSIPSTRLGATRGQGLGLSWSLLCQGYPAQASTRRGSAHTVTQTNVWSSDPHVGKGASRMLNWNAEPLGSGKDCLGCRSELLGTTGSGCFEVR